MELISKTRTEILIGQVIRPIQLAITLDLNMDQYKFNPCSYPLALLKMKFLNLNIKYNSIVNEMQLTKFQARKNQMPLAFI